MRLLATRSDERTRAPGVRDGLGDRLFPFPPYPVPRPLPLLLPRPPLADLSHRLQDRDRVPAQRVYQIQELDHV